MIPTYEGVLPYLSTEQMIEVDRLMIEDYGTKLIQMMENAGRGLALLARERFLAGDATGKSVLVLAGTGGNGGGALVAARRLHAWGARVNVVLAKPDTNLTPVPAQQLSIVRRLGIEVSVAAEPERSFDLILDGLIGYSLKGAPTGSSARLINWANGADVPILALDVPSGVDAAKGEVLEPAIRAAATLTLALPKQGLRSERVTAQVGELYLADISVPPQLYAEASLGLDVPNIFSQADVLKLT